MDILERVQIYIDSDNTPLLTDLIETCSEDFKDYCNREDVPDDAQSVIVRMVVEAYNKIGYEGVSSQSYSGISQSFINGYSDTIMKRMNKYRKLKTL